MKMLQPIVYIGFFLFMLLYLAGLKVKFSPLSIKFTTPLIALAWVFLFASLTLFTIHNKKIAYKEGVNDTKDAFREAFSKCEVKDTTETK